MLHQTQVITELSDDNSYVIPSGTLFAFPLTVGADTIRKIIAFHTAQFQQDRSMRVWVSDEVAGTQILSETLDSGYWHLNKNPHFVVGVFDQSLDEPTDIPASLAVQPGTYYVHFLNLTNRENSFAYFLDAGS